MKLAIVGSYFPLRDQPYRGRTAYKVALELRARMEIEAICPIARYPRWLQPRNFQHWRVDTSFSPEGIKTSYLEYAAVPGLTRVTNGFACTRSIEPLVRRAKPDILQGYYLYPEGYAAVRVGQKLGIPVVLVAIGSDVNRIPNRIAEHFTRRAIAGAAHVMTMGGHLRAQVIRLGADPAKTSCYTNGCDTDIFHLRDRAVCRKELNLDPAAPVIVYVGRLDMLKGLGELLEAAASLRPKYPSLRVVYIGDGPARPLLDARIRELQLDANVIFPGVCDSDAVARWLGACNVFALPSYAEGSPNVIIEALNCGRPVVASKVGGIPELFREDAGLLIPARDAQALAEALGEASSRKWDETAIAQRYRRPWSDLAKEMGDVLEAVASSANKKGAK